MTAQVENPPAAPAAPAVQPCLPSSAIDTSAVPHRMDDGVHVPSERYYSQEFADLEIDKMWLHTWQWAARVEDVQHVGDYLEYTIARESVMVVRTDADTIRVFQNVCPHRATRLVEACGTFGGGQIVCPFHGWRWNLDGSQSTIYGRRGFVPESIDPVAMGLREVRSEIRYGFVWINFDDQAPGLDDFFGTMAPHLDPLGIDRMRVRWSKYSILPANWKVTLEAFMEAYHVMQAHPELALGATGESYNVDAIPYFLHGTGHVDTTPPLTEKAAFVITESPVEGMGFGEWFLEQNRVLFEGTDATNTARDEFIADRVRGRNLPDEQIIPNFFQEYYSYAAEAGIPLPPPDPQATGYAFLFPNMVLLGLTGNLLYYRVRPNGTSPDESIFEVFAMQIPVAAEAEQPPARPEGPLEPEEWPFVLRQDIENIVRQQAGYRSSAFTEATMSPRYETMIFSLHNTIDQYLAQ